MDDRRLATEIAAKVAAAGGRAYFVGGLVRDGLLGVDCKDIDIEVHGIEPATLREILGTLGKVLEKGASFGVLGLEHSDVDIAMPRRESRTGAGHRDFDVSVDPWLTPAEAARRRDFTINALMQDILTGEIVDCYGGREDLKNGIIRCVAEDTFPEDALRVFRGAGFAARLKAKIAPDTLELMRSMDVTEITHERVFEELKKALLKAETPSVFFEVLRATDHLKEFFPEIEACIGVPQNPMFHPEGDVYVHTMKVLDEAALLRARAEDPLALMLSALTHDLGKCITTEPDEKGVLHAYLHETKGLPLVEQQLKRLTNQVKLIDSVLNHVRLHMRPNMLAGAGSKKKKTRLLFNESCNPSDLILLAMADEKGTCGKPFDPEHEVFLRERLEDYREIAARPRVTGKDLVANGVKPGPEMGEVLKRAELLHFSGMTRERALAQVLGEYKKLHAEE